MKYYQSEYSIDVHMMTDLPDEMKLKQMIDNNFSDLRNYSIYVKSLNSNKNFKIVNFGCSWGYSLYQLQYAGYDVQGYEVSLPRAKYGKKLGIEIVTDFKSIGDNNDIILSSHVIEHLSDVNDLFEIARKKLTPCGSLMVF